MAAYARASFNFVLQQTSPQRLSAIPAWTGTPFGIIEHASGTGLGQIDQVYGAERSIASATLDAVDLNGAIPNVIGTGNLTLLTVCGVFIWNAPQDPTAAANTTTLTVGAGANLWLGLLGNATAQLVLQPGEVFFRMGGGSGGLGTVTAATADMINLTNSAGATNKYQIAVWGRSVTP